MRTATIELDVEKTSDFTLDIDVCKAEEHGSRRFLTGVASGILEDADGERVSKNAIVDMSRQAVAGLKLVAGSHQQDWHNEIGDAVEIRHDPDNDELLVKCELPPEGEDPLADKAWLRQTKYGEKLGFSIGGKLQKAYFELTETGKKRKVLDGIGLRHFALTKKPSYRQSFALAVAKTAEALKAPADDAFTIAAEPDTTGAIVAKMAGWVDPEADVAKADSTVASTPQDAVGNRGSRDDDAPALDVNNDDDGEKPDEKKLPQGRGERHLACPNCGHEFAAAMPAEEDTPAEVVDGDDTNDRDAHKRAPESEETDMALDKTLENLRKLAGVTGEAEVAKKDEPAAGAELSDVEKLVAASHEAGQESMAALEEKVAKGFEGVTDVLKKVFDRLGEQPTGRKSVARAGTGTPTRAEVEAGTVAKTAGDDEPGEDLDERVGKIAGEGDAHKAMALLNKEVYGVDSHIVDRPTQSAGLAVPGWSE